MTWIWSVVLTGLGLTTLWFMSSPRARIRGYAFAGACAGQTLWITYGIVTRQWGFVISGVAYGIINGRNVVSSRRQTATEQPVGPLSPPL